MIVNCILRFKAQASAQRDVRTHLPVILYVQAGIHHGDRHGGDRAAVGCIERKLGGQRLRSATCEILHGDRVSLYGGEGEGAIKSGAGSIDFVNGP